MESIGGLKLIIMTNKEIKDECERAYEQINSAKNRLTEIRKNCSHEKMEQQPYVWRIGAVDIVNVCCYCGENLGRLTYEV